MRKIIFRAKGEGGDGEKKDNKIGKGYKRDKNRKRGGGEKGGAVGWDGVRSGRAGRRAAGLSRKRRGEAEGGAAGRSAVGRGASPPD